MKHILIVLNLFLIFTNLVHSQTIESKKTGPGTLYYQNGIPLSMKDLVIAVQSNEQAYDMMLKAKNNNVLSQVIGGIGGAMIGFPLGASLAGAEMNYKLLLAGLGITILSIPISIKSRKQTQKAVNLFNSGFSETSEFKFSPVINFSIKHSGILIIMTF